MLRNKEYYLTITESKKRYNRDGTFFYEKHKIFIYKEDFDKFLTGVNETIDFIKKEQPYVPEEEKQETEDSQGEKTNEETKVELDNKPEGQKAGYDMKENEAGEFSNVDFDELGSATDQDSKNTD